MIIPTDAEKAFDMIQHPSMIKHNNQGIEGNYLNLIKVLYEKLTETSYSMMKD